MRNRLVFRSPRAVAGLLAVLLPASVAAHANFVENTSGKREVNENARAFLRLNLAHTCGRGSAHWDIRDVALVFPNGADAVVQEWQDASGATKTPVAMTDVASTWETQKDAQGDTIATIEHGANAVMSIKPALDRDWKRILVHKGAVPAFYNHGVVEEDAVTLHWLGATSSGQPGLGNDLYDNLEFVSTFGKLKGCYTRLRVYMTSVHFCARGYVDAWLRAPTAMIDSAANGKISVSTGYAPYVDVVRDPTANPLPEACGGVGRTAEAYPSPAAIDAHAGALMAAHVRGRNAAAGGNHQGRH